jgi:flagellum-specific ATP synthase
MERAGRTAEGSITGIYTTLVEADDLRDPIGDACIATADGHIALSRQLAEQGHFPAVDVRQSLSRTMAHRVDTEHLASARALRRMLAEREVAVDLKSLGAYRPGVNTEQDVALQIYPRIERFLVQGESESAEVEETLQELHRIREAVEGSLASAAAGSPSPGRRA